jgi:signal transduction histidine kinase/DNA-binding NarL/FixJ family response regulator
MLAGGLAFTMLATGHLYGGWRRTQEIAASNEALENEVRTRLRAEHAAAAANEAKSDFLASMSHEIRTPLNAILGYTQLMQRDRLLGPEQRDAITGIHASGRHLLGLINEVLDLAKIEAGRMVPQPVDFHLATLAQGLATTFKPLCAQKRIGFRIAFDPASAGDVRGDEGKLRQVLINLLGNAVKFTPAGEVYLHFRPEADGRWLFEVIDTGFGIPPEEQGVIFEPFHQGNGAQHQGGTGLGLAIARRQVELLGGTLALESERGIGSRFFFSIPLAAPVAPAKQTTSGILNLTGGSSVKVLVIDDRPDNRQVLGGLLSSMGCQVWLSETAAAAVALAHEHEFDLIFLDWLLPGSDGTALARQLLEVLRARPPKLVMHSASALLRHRQEALAAGCVGVLDKPFTAEQLGQCLRGHLGIELETTSTGQEPERPPDLEPGSVTLPEKLCARLMVAAELHSSTALKAALQELRELSPEASALAEHLRHRMRSFDMDGVQQLLSRCVAARPGAADPTSPHEVCGTSRRPA